MKESIRIQSIFPEMVGEDAFNELLRIYPQGRTLRSFDCTLPADDPRLQSITKILADADLRPWLNRMHERQRGEYTLYRIRTFEPADYAAAEYFTVGAAPTIEGLFRTPDGRIKLRREHLKVHNKNKPLRSPPPASPG
jgi:hypothetical protein